MSTTKIGGVTNSSQSPDIGQNSDRGISDFRISGQSFIKEDCHNSRTSDDIDMTLGPITELNKRNEVTSKKLTMTSLLFFRFIDNLE